MNIEVNIEEYLTESEIKELVIDTVKSHIRSTIGHSPGNLMTTLARLIVKDSIQEIIPNFEELLNTHIKECISKFSLENLFWESFGWKSNGNKLLNKVLVDNEPLIQEKIKSLFTVNK